MMPGYSKWYRAKNNRPSQRWSMLLRVIGMMVAIPVVIVWAWFWANILKDLPDISEIEDLSFKQATTITDRNGEVLYTLFEENRQYIPFEDMSEKFVNAIVATEDQRFWTNPWIDRKGIIRAWIVDLTTDRTQWWSTLTQQLIKNVMLTNERSYKRKLKEIVLALRLNDYIKDDIRKKYKNISSSEVDRKMKEKVLELYSNYIFLWNNSYGVETASQTYFDKSAKDVTILEAAILWGIPQAPSTYDPYNNRAILMWELLITDKVGNAVEVSEDLKTALFEKVRSNIQATNISFKRDDEQVLDYLKGLLSFEFTQNDFTYQIQYKAGRKDFVLARMYEEEYITESEFKRHFVDAFTYEFKRWSREIKAPHFVFWVIKMLDNNYWPELLRNWWLTIRTSLDYGAQKMAEQSIIENEQHLTNYNVGNAALVYLNSHNGDIIAYVWSKDYYNDDIDGQVDIIQSKRQPGSTIKPFVYSLGFWTLALTMDSPIYDVNFKIWENTPQNADGKFNGLMALKNALAYSRNIPAIKMFFAVWWEEKLKPYLKSLWMQSLSNTISYGYPLSIGAWEVPMLELANAYAHLSAMWKPAEINPILEVRASDDTILYKKQINTQEQVIPAWVWYLMWNILSNKKNFPADWIKTFSFSGISFATKSWTTNVKRWEDKLPRDAWLAAYTPSHVMVFRGGNTDGSALRKDAFWWWINSPIWKTFSQKLQNDGRIQEEIISEREVKSVSISKVSWKLASYETPLALTKQSLWYINSLPTQVDNNISKIQVDTMCNGEVSEYTPPTDIAEAYIITPQSIIPDGRDNEGILTWRRNGWLESYGEQINVPLLLEKNEGICEERRSIAELWEISLEIIQPEPWQLVSKSFSLRHHTVSPFTITTLKLYLNDIELSELTYNKQGNVTDISTVIIPEEIAPGSYTLKAVVFDDKWYSDTQVVPVTIQDWQDTTAPYLIQDKIKITKKDNEEKRDIILLFWDDASTIASGNVSIWENSYPFQGNIAMFTVDTLWEATYTVSDSFGNVATNTISLSVD